MRRLISAYINKYINHTCESCPRICRSLLYSAFVVDRQKFYTWDAQTKVWATATSLANLQTQGFLLGLSVIGLIGILGNVWSNMLRPLLCASSAVPPPLSVEVTPRKTRPYSY
ncbi:unnamed protein product [Pieris brassicae]|nr:unnamed protein product [Pieris brassicae]